MSALQTRPSAPDQRSTAGRGLSTARAALRVVSFLAQHPEGVTARQVAGEIGKSVSTAYDLLASLDEEGFVRREPGRGYRLRPAAAIAGQELTSGDLLARAVRNLLARTHRRCYLGRVQEGALVLDIHGRQGIPTVPGLGLRVGCNAHALAIGKLVLSLMPELSSRRYAERGLRAYTPHTITAPGALLAELEEVRSNGFAVSRAEFAADVNCIAAPVFDARGRFMAALGVSTSARTFAAEADGLLAAVREEAAAVKGTLARSPRFGGEPRLVGERDKFGARPDADLDHRATDVGLDGRGADD